MKITEWIMAIKKDKQLVAEAIEKIADLNRKIKDKEAELEILSKKQTLIKREYELDKREAELIIKNKDVAYVERMQFELKFFKEQFEEDREIFKRSFR